VVERSIHLAIDLLALKIISVLLEVSSFEIETTLQGHYFMPPYVGNGCGEVNNIMVLGAFFADVKGIKHTKISLIAATKISILNTRNI